MPPHHHPRPGDEKIRIVTKLLASQKHPTSTHQRLSNEYHLMFPFFLSSRRCLLYPFFLPSNVILSDDLTVFRPKVNVVLQKREHDESTRSHSSSQRAGDKTTKTEEPFWIGRMGRSPKDAQKDKNEICVHWNLWKIKQRNGKLDKETQTAVYPIIGTLAK